MQEVDLDAIEVLGIEDVDVHDETSLRWLSDQVQDCMNCKVRVSVLNTEQWNSILHRYLGSRYRGAAPHLHVLVDPKVAHHLLVSPSAVLGVGQGSSTIISEVVYGILAAGGAPLSNFWKHGVHQYFAKQISQGAGLKFQNDYHPREYTIVRELVNILVHEHGYTALDWYRALKRKPGSVYTALARTSWAGQWIATARKNPRLVKEFDDGKITRDSFIKALTNPERHVNDQIILFTQDLLEGKIQIHGT
jgi:hypothetical protein